MESEQYWVWFICKVIKDAKTVRAFFEDITTQCHFQTESLSICYTEELCLRRLVTSNSTSPIECTHFAL
ncbi:unnamed protein product [Agarophyton chilense]